MHETMRSAWQAYDIVVGLSRCRFVILYSLDIAHV